MGLYREAITYANEALRFATPYNRLPYAKVQCYGILRAAYKDIGNTEMLYRYTDSLCTATQDVIEEYPTLNTSDFELSCALNMAYSLIEAGQMEEAWKAIEESDGMMGDSPYLFLIYQSNANKMYYYRAIGNIERCQEYYQLCYDYCRENNLEFEVRNLLRFRANTLSTIGQFDKSAQLYNQLLFHIDSVNRNRLGVELQQLQEDFESDKKEFEIAHKKDRSSLTIQFIVSLSILLLLLVVLAFIILNILRSIRKKNHSLFSQIAELNTTKKELTKYKEMLQNNLQGVTEDERIDPDDNILFDKTENYMQVESPYTKADFGRHELVTAMNTSETNLARAIKKRARLTTHEYINRWRMKYATQLLLTQPNLSIEAIANDAGFSSSRNFYQLFKEQHGMSPAEFRSYAKSERERN
jgi:AraC-type DNA-binding domain-containing proteins